MHNEPTELIDLDRDKTMILTYCIDGSSARCNILWIVQDTTWAMWCER